MTASSSKRTSSSGSKKALLVVGAEPTATEDGDGAASSEDFNEAGVKKELAGSGSEEVY